MFNKVTWYISRNWQIRSIFDD